MTAIVEAVLTGMAVLLAGTIPRNIVFAANLRTSAACRGRRWSRLCTCGASARYLRGRRDHDANAVWRRDRLRAKPLSARVWRRALIAGFLGLAALVVALRVLNRVVALPEQQAPDLSAMPTLTVLTLLLVSSLNAGVVEEAAFRGYMQGPIERQAGPAIAIVVTGIMFAIAHLEFTPVLLPYYVAVAAIYGAVTYLTASILPAVVLHTAGNIYSNADLWLSGRAEWQSTSRGDVSLSGGADAAFWLAVVAELLLLVLTFAAYRRLAAVTTRDEAT